MHPRDHKIDILQAGWFVSSSKIESQLRQKNMVLDDFKVKYSDQTLSSHCVCVGGLSQFCPNSTVWRLQAPFACAHQGPKPLYRPQHIAPSRIKYWETLKVHQYFMAIDKIKLFFSHFILSSIYKHKHCYCHEYLSCRKQNLKICVEFLIWKKQNAIPTLRFIAIQKLFWHCDSIAVKELKTST